MTDLKSVFAPLLAIIILAVIGFQTTDALRHSGMLKRKSQTPRVVAPDPYARLEAQLASPAGQTPDALRDPFTYGRTPVVVRRAPDRPYVPPPPPKPLLTAILADNDPRALIRYRERNFTVKPGDQFEDLRVISITADQVVLDRKGERIALYRPTKGD